MTLFETVYDVFFKRVLEDPDFFEYTNVPEFEVDILIRVKAFEYLDESISKIYEITSPQIDLDDWDTSDPPLFFNEDLTRKEIQMFANLMFEMFLSRDLAKLKIYNKFFTTNEINTFSPAQDRKTFVEMYDLLVKDNEQTIKRYGSRDRLTNALLGVI